MPQRRNAFIVLLLLICFVSSRVFSDSNIQESLQRDNSSISCTLAEFETDYFTECSPIEINSNQDFGEFSSSGTGVKEDPYIIERLFIVATGSQNSSISVSYTSVHFIIRDCYVTTDWVGIEIKHVSEGTVTLANNTCISNSGDGAGIVIWGAYNCTIIKNRCSNLSQGIHLNEAGRCNIVSNNITDNNYQGINIRYSHSNIITANLIANSSQHGVALVGTSNHNVIHHNQFVDNSREETYRIDGEQRGELTSQGFDEGYNNTWYNVATQEGNWWSDYSESGSYVIDGPSNAIDLYPIVEENQLQSSGENQPQSSRWDLLQTAVVISFIGIFVILLVLRFLRTGNSKS